MPRGKARKVVRDPRPEVPVESQLPDDDFVGSLRQELARTQAAAITKPAEDLSHRAELNRRLLQDLWEIHNQFEDISVHLTLEPSATLFATFVEYPTNFSFKDNFDFGSVSTLELADRAAGWVGFSLRFWYYRDAEGKGRLRGIFEWTDGESYHRYSGWMRSMSQAILYDASEPDVDLKSVHKVLRDVVVKWYAAHLDRTPEGFVQHLRQKYPKGTSYAKESYR